MIVYKLIAGRAQDVADIEAILAGGTPLDEAYLAHWTASWAVDELWRRTRGR